MLTLINLLLDPITGIVSGAVAVGIFAGLLLWAHVECEP